MGTSEEAGKLDWLQALREGRSSACEQLYAFLRERVMPVMRAPPGVDREDVLADTASAVWQSIRLLRDETKFLPFVTTIARRIASRRRRDCARFETLPRESMLPPDAPVAHANMESDEVLQILSSALRQSDQRLFRLLYVQGASSAEVQATLHISPETLRKRKHRLRLRLRQAASQATRPAPSAGAERLPEHT
jgi:RNA polymerase sigma factor (sigma-70 family)